MDDKDPFSGSIHVPAIKPGRIPRRVFDFRSDAEGREWLGHFGGQPLRLSSRLWGERPSPWNDDKPRHGKVFLADIAVVKTMIEARKRIVKSGRASCGARGGKYV